MPIILEGADNYCDMRADSPKVPMCPSCEVFFDPYGHSFPGCETPKYDLSTTNEHMHLASPRLKAFLEESCTSPIEYFETGGGYFILRPKREVVLDMRGFGINPTGACQTCGEPNGVYSSIRFGVEILGGQEPVGPMDMVRSRQRFGERRQRNFLLLIGSQLAKELKAQKFKGLSV